MSSARRPTMPRCAVLLLAAALLPGCRREQPGPDPGPDSAAEPTPAPAGALPLFSEDLAADSLVVLDRIRLARSRGLDTLPIGLLVAELGRTFVGTPYVPQTLEVPGEERLVINLRALDCVTFVENVLALASAIRAGGGFAGFTRELARIRYRTGAVTGYPSRLHYFSEWISANAARGVVSDITRELGGIRDSERLDFMSTHRESYRQLADDSVFRAVRELEARLAEQPRYYIPEGAIADVAARIRDGDVIAATSALPGLDVVHTGLAVWQDGALHLMHAPLVGDSVEISTQPLAVRIQRIATQDGIMVARPLD